MIKQAGTSLLEILVSVVVIAVGLLGIAALQTSSIRYNHSAQLRSIAVFQANNMYDRMRANTAGVKAGSYNNITGIPSATDCSTTCSSSQIAQRDAYQWNTVNALMLPSGAGTVVTDSSHYIITVRWDGSHSGVTGTGCSGNPAVDLDCFVMEVQI